MSFFPIITPRLLGREHHDWRVIVTRSAPFGVQVEFGCEWLTATGLYRIRARSGVSLFIIAECFKNHVNSM